MKNRILVTGLGGFIGSHILEHFLINTDWDIIGIDSWRHKGTPERIEEVLKDHPEWKARVTMITHDLIAPIQERTQKRIGHVDFIINCASESHVDRSIDDPEPFITNNVALATNMLEYARTAKPRAFIQISTDEVSGPAPDGVYFEEWSATLPSNPYAASKACQEAIAVSYWRTYGVPVVITNTENNFGEMQDTEKYIAKIIRCVTNGETLTVHGSEGQIGSRFYLHARNHADALLWLLKRTPTAYPDADRPDKFNVISDVEIDNLSLAHIVAEIIGKPLKYELVDFHSVRPGHDRRYALSGEKIKKLGWVPPMSFRDSLERYVKWTLRPEHEIWR